MGGKKRVMAEFAQCKKCGETKPMTHAYFRLESEKRNRRNTSRCRACLAEETKLTLRRRALRFKENWPVRPDSKVCTDCDTVFPGLEFRRSHASADGYSAICRHCRLVRNQAKLKRERAANPIVYAARAMFCRAKQRAHERDLGFDLTIEYLVDICVDTCPVFDIPLRYDGLRKTDDSASLDRFFPERGYVRGNVFVISSLANSIKNKGTSTQVQLVAAWMRRIENGKAE